MIFLPGSKSLVFISHITQEKEVAVKLKELINSSFLGLIEVFISSDEESITMGKRWLDGITEALKQCVVEVVVCSPESVKRPWINFEAGAGWIRDIPVVPLCHSGMKRDQLPIPLNMLQAANADDALDLDRIFRVFAKAIGADNPKISFDDFIAKIRLFEEKYTFWDQCNSAFACLEQVNPEIIPTLGVRHSSKTYLWRLT